MRVQGLSATVIWADGELSIEHAGAAQRLGAPPWVQIPEGLITGVELRKPNLVRNGMLQIHVAGIDPGPMEPANPYTIVFTRRSTAAFDHLRQQIEIMAAERQS